MHLDYPSFGPSGSPMPHTPSKSSASHSGSSDGCSSSSPASKPNLDSQSASSSSSVSSSPSGSCDELRRRSGLPSYHPQTTSGVRHCPDGAPRQGGLPANMPMQMLWWQQMYARHYYMQYQAAVAASQPPRTPPPSPPPSSPHQPAQPNEAVQPPLGPNPAQDPLQENLPANPVQMNAQGGPVLNDDELNQDWLDWLYTLSRAGVLLSIVYFYSSFSRFVMVFSAIMLVYLHQGQWFPFRPEQQNVRRVRAGAPPRERAGAPPRERAGAPPRERAGAPPRERAGAPPRERAGAPPRERAGAPPREAQRQQGMQEIERLMDEGMEDDDSGEEGAGGNEDRVLGPARPEPNILTVAWAFISTFFTSLIPDVQPHLAN